MKPIRDPVVSFELTWLRLATFKQELITIGHIDRMLVSIELSMTAVRALGNAPLCPCGAKSHSVFVDLPRFLYRIDFWSYSRIEMALRPKYSEQGTQSAAAAIVVWRG
ncbi:MAG TPA: hypothetical protein VH325_00930 [Bryobacteraceae bacterium]|nr:hypothetical protein [Bryobacteraceae bacterium]